MPVALSSDGLAPGPAPASAPREEEAAPARVVPADNALPFAAGLRALMVLFGFIPFLHLGASLALLAAPLTFGTTYKMFLLGLGILYLAGPLVVRVTTLLAPGPHGRFDINSRPFLLWWFTAQWQVLFNRLPVLEELLRMVPGLYSLWLRCWGAKVGRLVYWSPGLAILDRPLVDVGSRVVFGVGVRVNPHLLGPDADTGGRMILTVAPVRIGDDALVGGYSFLPPGAAVAAGEVLPGMKTMRMFTEWRDGKRHDADTAMAPTPSLSGRGQG